MSSLPTECAAVSLQPPAPSTSRTWANCTKRFGGSSPVMGSGPLATFSSSFSSFSSSSSFFSSPPPPPPPPSALSPGLSSALGSSGATSVAGFSAGSSGAFSGGSSGSAVAPTFWMLGCARVRTGAL
ncbi:hypothetical protein [Streptomyces sp. NPDC093109]|uniref:hypothetical protein n=1 Tax=Streptomyces sp. NPDC093109 TaxID=3154977 RepID=UPI00344ED9B0